MDFNWFELFDKDAFLATGLVSRLLTVTLEGIGEKEILISKGIGLAITCDGVFLPLGLKGENPYAFDGYAILEDEDGMIWLGVEK